MDKTGIAMIVVGILLLIAGVYGIMYFFDAFVESVKGLIGLVVALIGLFSLIIGAMIVKD